MPGGLFYIRPTPVTYKASDSFGFFMQSDPHWGASDTDQALLRRERDLILRRRDRLNVNGDIYDAILTRDGKRYEPTNLHKRLQGRNDIMNGAIDMAYEYYAPVAHLIDMIGCGNHDTAVEKHHNFDPVAVLVQRLNLLKGAKIAYGGYGGLIQYKFAPERLGGVNHCLNIFYWHGAGGGATAASAASEFEKKGFVEGADVFWIGHKHLRSANDVERLYISPEGKRPRRRVQWNIRTGSYFDTYEYQSQEDFTRRGRQSNYAADALLQPRGKGGIRLVLGFDSQTSKKSLKVELN